MNGAVINNETDLMREALLMAHAEMQYARGLLKHNKETLSLLEASMKKQGFDTQLTFDEKAHLEQAFERGYEGAKALFAMSNKRN